MGCYEQLTIEERVTIGCMKELGYSQNQIGRHLGRNRSTISREISRCEGKYSANRAQRDAMESRRRRGRKSILRRDDTLRKQIEELLWKYLSPEQISGRMKVEGHDSVSYATIYRAIEKGLLSKERLRIKGKRYRKGHQGGCGHLTIEHSIHDRPSDTREESGHWESDTVLGKAGTGVIATYVERRSRYVVMEKLEYRRATEYTDKTIERFEGMRIRSLTVDNGKEFSQYKRIQDSLGARVYFCDPGMPGQRGTNENTNGLIRQFYPKLSSLKNVTQTNLTKVEKLLNMRPRKCLNYKTPYEVFHEQVLHLI
ncbi:IS30 family transposase [Eubacteriales bacterium OttesenSCG-928-N14]|nr:IS30 family transposase [Eubacteriales bacterium OttesenSCG-928-N14]